MTARWRSPSLFWTFAGSFLLVLVLAGVLQGVVAVAVIRPLAALWTGARAEGLVRAAAARIESLPAPVDDEAIRAALRAAGEPPPAPGLVFRHRDGAVVAPEPLSPWRERHLVGLLEGRAEPRFGPPPGEADGPPGGPEAGPERRRGRSAGAGPRSDRGRLEVLHRRPVTGAAVHGEVAAVGLEVPRSWLPPRQGRRVLLLALPVAVLLSGAAGLVLFRHLLRRLRSIEMQAARVTEGDLEARIRDTGPDEIGRLGSTLNTMTERLQTARNEIAATEAARRRLLADISHELGTPLTSIRGHAETLLDAEVPLSDAERRAYLDTILDEARRMDLLIQDLFELTRLEAGAGELATERLDWAALCRNTAERFRSRFRQAGLELAWRGGDAPVWVDADGRRMEQVLDNLLVNALRHVPAGGSVEVGLVRDGARAVLAVEDDGPGIPPQALPHVFERFYRADPARAGGGSGLGLAIVREIVERHGGRASAAPRHPAGVRFTVELPAA